MKAKHILFAVAAIVVIIGIVQLPIGSLATDLVRWIQENRAVAWPIYIVAYIVATVLMLPGSILTLAAGFVFGLPIGVMLVSVSSVLGATSAFIVGRYIARDWVADRIAALPRFSALDRATQRDGKFIVLLVRLSPIFPFNLTNYGLGLTGVKLRDYVLASWIGMLPGTILYVYVGTLALDIAELTSGGTSLSASRYIWGIGFIATLALTVFIARIASQALNAQLNDTDPASEIDPVSTQPSSTENSYDG